MPEESRSAAAAEEPQNQAPQFVAGGGGSTAPWHQPRERDRDDYYERAGPDRQIGYREEPRAPAFIKSDEPQYNSREEGEAAFLKLLKKAGVQSDWTWEQTMRATIKDPQYRSIQHPSDRKAAFEKYVIQQKENEREEEEKRLSDLRARFGKMLRSHEEIKHYTRWKTAKPILEHEAIFRSAKNDDERRLFFEEYLVELKKTHVEQQAQIKKSAMDELQAILKGLDLEPYTRWAEAHPRIESSERFASDDKFKTLSKSDVLTAFENHIKSLERHFNDERQREKASKARKERQNRDAFISLLRQLKTQGKIKAGTQWMKIHPEIENDPRYTNMLGQAGSSPLELFWDVIEEEERALRGYRNEVYDVLEDKRYEVTPKTSFEEFREIVVSDRRTRDFATDTLELIFQRLLEKVKKREDDDKHASERHTRRAIDALRSRIKHLDDPIVRSSSLWEDVKPRLERMEEYKALETDEQRKQAFDKVIRRLKEKDEDAERKREYRDRGRDRYHDRDREGDRLRRSRPSRTPEPEDAYAAERRKAMAERERQYHKGSSTGLSPPRDRRDRDRYDRYSRDEGRLNSYDRDRDRDRRDRRPDSREDERERLYRLRGDPRVGRDELDYGGGGGGAPSASGRRRRGSDADSVGSSRKRVRYDRSPRRRKEEEAKEAKKEEVAMHSGSEEGEMVED